MLRSLIIRQLFFLLNLVLAAVIAFLVYQFMMELIRDDVLVGAANNGDLVVENYSERLAKIDSRQAYDSIIDSGLFGRAGRNNVDSIVEPEAEGEGEDETMETELPLKLWSTTAMAPMDPNASAAIENTGDRTRQTYFIGDFIIEEQATLEAVYPNEIIIFNSLKKKREKLVFDLDEEEDVKPGPRRRRPVAARADKGSNVNKVRISIPKDELIEELNTDIDELMAQAKPEVYRDKNGNVAGITAEKVSGIPLADKLGLTDGDVITSINGEKIDSEQKILEIIAKNQDATNFRIRILRNGRSITKTYSLK